MIDDCNINNLAKNQVSAVFNSRAIRRSVLSKFIEICMGRHPCIRRLSPQYERQSKLKCPIAETIR